MILQTLGLALRAGILLQLLRVAQAVPSVNVDLRAAFDAPPYLVELLETAAQENETSYFPLLDKIADGYFDGSVTDQQLYSKFRNLLKEDGHLQGPEDLSSFDLALSMHSAAPLVEAHYQFYHTSAGPLIQEHGANIDGSWAFAAFTGEAFTSSDLSPTSAIKLGKTDNQARRLPFDRILGDSGHQSASILYADVLSESFRNFHRAMSPTARAGKTSYRVRYIPSKSSTPRPLAVSGYGVELALKRTDYIVIDDRQAEEGQKSGHAKIILGEEELSDLRPLSASELRYLDMKAASFVMSSGNPMEMLAKMTQDFPKYSSAIAGMNVSDAFSTEHAANRELVLPAGFNVIWINGVQIVPRDVNAYNLLEVLRQERKMINGVRELGLSGPDAISLLSHEAIYQTKVSQDVQRYDWRDDHEGGGVIMWLNDMAKDKRYEDWPETIQALLQRTFPGQLPVLRRNVNNLIIPIDFSKYVDVGLVVETLQTFVKRNAPIRFGLVPRLESPAAIQQASVIYHLLDTYGLAAALGYLEASVAGAGFKMSSPQEKYFNQAIEGRKLRRDRVAKSLEDVLVDNDITKRLDAARGYAKRLVLNGPTSPIFANGVPIPFTEEWMNPMSQRMSLDIRILQQGVYTSQFDEDADLAEYLLEKASLRRAPMVIPEDDDQLLHLDLNRHPELAELPHLPANLDTIEHELAHIVLFADLDTSHGFEQFMEVLLFQREHYNVEVAWLNTVGESETQLNYQSSLDDAFVKDVLAKFDVLEAKEPKEEPSALNFAQRSSLYHTLLNSISVGRKDKVTTVDPVHRRILEALKLEVGQAAIVINGRITGPLSKISILEKDDLETLFAYERKQRLLPASTAIKALQLEGKAASPFAFAKISNLIALSQKSEVPAGIDEAAPSIRTDAFKQWGSEHTAVKSGDFLTANIQIVASIDPASELAQRWVPMLKVLSELEGVATRIFLNPKDRLDELPVKRFYRYVLESQPRFDENGTLSNLGAEFAGLPAEALLNIGMDLPPSWLVAPKDSIHDLDNIKLSAVKSGADISATYELEHILIEGHSTDHTTGQPPRGAQLVLRTDQNPHLASTIIMANLGYFQFKANPGVYHLTLQEGRSEDIFHIDSAGTMGNIAGSDDNVTEIALTSFSGTTLFPRLSRHSGMELEDVLESPRTALENLADNADKLLAQAGLTQGDMLAKAARYGSALFSGSSKGSDVTSEGQAEINIFSVASGHLYERMLNIMMLSVMKHTKHTVKFWFIEQFLSPSFKDFLPTLAEEYKFRYEMVTYKWPHWLRGQKEKQREIWGYKILFLDVLFPLDLDKVIFVDADQIVRTDMYELVELDLQGAPYGFTPMCDSRVEMEGFRFWKQGYWKNFLRGLPYHISALYVVDLKKFRQIAAGDRLRGQYHQLSADPGSLSNLDQDLPNHMQTIIPIHSLPQDWLWCETWCSDEALRTAKTIDLCNNPQTKEPKLDRARRQVPEWTLYDDEIAAVAKRYRQQAAQGGVMPDNGGNTGVQGDNSEGIQERLQREDAERERKANEDRPRDEL